MRFRSQSQEVLVELTHHVLAGLVCFALAGIWLIACGWLYQNPLTRPEQAALCFGFVMSMVPVIVCVSIGCLARGEQAGPHLRSDD